MRRMRARWVLGSALLLGGAAVSCGGGDADGLFTPPSSNAGIGGALSAGGANHAGAAQNGGRAGAMNHARGGAGSGAGAASEAGAAQGGAIGHAGAGADPTSGAGGSLSGAGTGGAHAGSGGTMTAASGAAGTAGSHAGNAGVGGSQAGSAGAGGGPAGAGGASAGAGGAAAGAAGAAAGAGGATGAPCADNAGCLPSEYCDKSSCDANAAGNCLPTPTHCDGEKLAVVCGCNGVTYHDACLLHHGRTNSAALDGGACSKAGDGTVTCTENDSLKCSDLGGVCGFKTENACIASGPVNMGICWVLPASCPGSDANTVQTCDGQNTACISECDAIQQTLRYAVPNHCN